MKDLITILKVCIRENFVSLKSPNLRINEPTMAMAFEEQVRGFEVASAFNGPLAPVQCFAAFNASKAIGDATKILELGCGTGHVLTKMAFINPDKHFIALDLSQGMLDQAKKLAHKMKLSNIEFHLGDMTNLSSFKDQGIDAVTSSLALHHLRSHVDLVKTFKEVHDLLGTKGSFSFYDLGKLKHKGSIYDFISLHNNHLPVYVEDTVNSYLAAFTKEEFSDALKLSGLVSRAQLQATIIIPTFMKANTKLRKLNIEQKMKMQELVDQLSMQNKFLFYLLKFYFLSF